MKIVYHVVVIGAGGTGSFFLKEFARYAAALRLKTVDTIISLAIIDGDHIEQKNLERQAFIPEDIDCNKAMVMASAIQENFGLQRVRAYPEYIDTDVRLKEIFSGLSEETRKSYDSAQEMNVLIGCSDNHRVRQVMDQVFRTWKGTLVYFDAANEFSNGEVVLAGIHEGKVLGRTRADYYPEIMEDRSPRASETSCGAVNQSSPQHIATNMMAANIMLGRLANLISENAMLFGIVIFDVFRMSMRFYRDEESREDAGSSE